MKLNEVKVLFLDLTNRCNGKCITCWHSNNNPFGEFEIDEKIYIEVRDKLFGRIKIFQPIGGGEVFLYRHFDKVIEDIKGYNFKTIITSNFSSISENQKQLLKDVNVEFVVSLDGSYKELQEFLRPNCNYDTVINNIKTFKNWGKKIILQVTVSNYNFYDMDKMLKLAEELKVGVRFQSAQYLSHLDTPYKFSKPPIDLPYLEKIIKKSWATPYNIIFDNFIYEDNEDSLKTLHTCSSFWNKVKNRFDHYCPNTADTVYVQGNRILSCCLPESKVMGDLKNHTMEEIIGSEMYDQNRKNCRCRIMEARKEVSYAHR